MLKKNILISGWYGPNNFGDEAILEAIIGQLKDEKNIEEDRIVVLSLNKIMTKKLFPNIRVCQQFPNDLKELIKSVITLNIFVTLYYLITAKSLFMGGGGFLSDWQSRNFGWLSQLLIVKLFRGKCYLWGVGIGPFNREFSTKLTSLIFNKCVSFAYVRDNVSLNTLLNKLNYNNEVIVRPDPVANMNVAPYVNNKKSNGKEIIFIPASYFKRSLFEGEQYKYRKLILCYSETIKYLIDSGYNVKVVFFQPKVELELKEDIESELENKNSVEFVFPESHRDAFKLIDNSIGVISFRLHGNIMSYAMNKKFLPLIYHFKAEEFLQVIKLDTIPKIIIGDGVHIRNTDIEFVDEWLPQIKLFLSGINNENTICN